MQTRVPQCIRVLTALVLSASVAACGAPVPGAEGASTETPRAPTDSENRELLAEVNGDNAEDLELHAFPLVALVVIVVGGAAYAVVDAGLEVRAAANARAERQAEKAAVAELKVKYDTVAERIGNVQQFRALPAAQQKALLDEFELLRVDLKNKEDAFQKKYGQDMAFLKPVEADEKTLDIANY